MADLCIHLKDQALIEKIRANYKSGEIRTFAENVLNAFFNDRLNQLKMMDKDKLAEYALKLERKGKQDGTKED